MPPEQKPQNNPNNSIPVREGLEAPELSSMIETESTQTALENQALDALSFARADEASLEPTLTEVQQTVPLTADDLPKVASKYRFWAIRGSIVALALLLVGLGGFAGKKALDYRQSLAKQGSVATNYAPNSNPLNDLANQAASGLSVVTDSSARLTVNGTLDINGSLIINQSGKPTNPVKGQIYYSKTDNKLWFYDGTRFIDITYASSAPTSVSSVQGQTGAVTFTGGRGISVTGTTISSTLPTGVQSLLAGSANITITSDGNGGYTITDANGGVGVELQNSTPGSPQTGNINITGTIIAGSFQGDGSGLTNLNASNVASGTLDDARLSTNVTLAGNTFNGVNQLVQLDGSGFLPALNGSALTNLNASNIASGTLADARLSANVTLQGNIFNGANQLVKLNPSGDLPALSGINLTNLNASAVTAGTLPDARLSANVTLMGNTFNGANQLLQLTNLGYLPVVNGSNVTALNASNISSGTLADGRLSANVALLDGNQTFSGSNTFSSAINANTITPSGALTVGATGQSFTLQGNGSSTITATSGGFTNTIGFTGVPIGNVAYNFDRSVTAGTYTICTTYGNCAGTGGGVTTPGGTPNKLARFTGAQTIGDSAITDTGAIVTIQNSSDSINGFQIQNSAGTSNLFIADTTNTRIGIGMTSPAYTLDVNGDINSATGLRVAGNLVCDSSGCIAGGGSGFYIQNSTALQTAANFDIESADPGEAAGVVRGTTGQTADIFQVWQGATLTGRFMTNGNLSISGNYLISGSQISSSNLADYSNIAHLNGIQTFSANNTFTGQVLLQNSIDSTIALRIQNSAGTSNLFVADTTNTRIGIGTSTPGYMLDVNGDINIPTGAAFRINGVAICGVAPTCAPSSGSSYYIQNSTALQTNANFNIVSANSASVGGIIRGASGQTADLFRLQDETGANVATFANNGRLILGQNAAATGTINFRHVTDIGDITLVPGSPGVGSYTLTLPAENGTLCSTGSVCAGYASSSGSGNYIQNGTAIQTTANFAIQSAAAGSVGGVIRGAASQTADLLQFQNSSGTVLGAIQASGSIQLGGGTTNYTAVSVSSNILTLGLGSSIGETRLNASGATYLRVEGTRATVYIGTGVNSWSAPGTLERLRVSAAPTTVDNAANAIFSATSAAAKPLVVQGFASQSANLQQWQNSAGTVLSSVGSNGFVGIGKAAAAGYALSIRQTGTAQDILFDRTDSNGVRIGAYWQTGAANGVTIEDLISSVTSSPGGYGIRLGNVFSTGITSGNYDQVRIMTNNFNPASGSSQFNYLAIQGGAITQTGTASGITRGILINPTLTSAVDFRGIEIANASGKGLWQTGSSVPNYFAGNVGIGSSGTAGTVEKFRVNTPTTVDNTAATILSSGATTSKALVVQGVASQSANLQEWQDSTTATLAYVSNVGRLKVASGGSAGLLVGTTAGLTTSADGGNLNINNSSVGQYIFINPSSTGTIYLGSTTDTAAIEARRQINISSTADAVKLQIQGAATQTANLQEWQNNGGTVLGSVSAAGLLSATAGAFGTTPAASGTVRIPNAGTLVARNAANSGDVVFATVDSSNIIRIGGAGQAGIILGTSGGGTGTTQIYGASAINLVKGAGSTWYGAAPTTGDALADNIFGVTATTQKGIVVQGKASQTANLQEWQNSSGTALAWIRSSGELVTATIRSNDLNADKFISPNGNSFVYSTFLSHDFKLYNGTAYVSQFTLATSGQSALLSTSSSAVKGLVIKGVASQTANLQEWQDSSGTALLSVTAAGAIQGAPSGGAVTVNGGTAAAVGTGGAVTIQAGAGGATSGNGGGIGITSGSATASNSSGGALTLTSGSGSGSSGGGQLTLQAGAGGATGTGASILINSGAGGSTSGNSGAVNIYTNDVTSGTAGNITLNVGSSTTGNGSILIGNSSLTQTITIGNTTGATAVNIKAGSGIVNVSTTQADATTVANFNNAGATTCSVQPGGTGFACSSDARLKTNVATVVNPQDIIRQLRGVTFNWTSSPNGQAHSGFIAQELEQLIPSAVSTDSNGYKVANYTEIIPYLVGAAQVQDLQITGMQQTQTSLQQTQTNNSSRLTTLEQKVAALEAAQPQGSGNSFNSLNVSGTATIQNLTVTGSATIATLTVTGDATFAGNIRVNGHIIGNADTRGTVTVPATQTSVKHTFAKPYEPGTEPNVVLTAKNGFAPSYRVESTETDFTVFFQTPVASDMEMNYQVQQ